MALKARVVTRDAFAEVDVECTHCGVRMSGYQSGPSRVRYFRCAGCHRWVSSMYSEVLQSDAKVRTRPKPVDGGKIQQFSAVKSRLEQWLSALEEQDPYRVLDISPNESSERIRARYHELAMQRHPDRGGSPEQMQELNAAYDRIERHRRSAPTS